MMTGLKQKRYMSLTALEQTRAMMTANVIDASDTVEEVASAGTSIRLVPVPDTVRLPVLSKGQIHHSRGLDRF